MTASGAAEQAVADRLAAFGAAWTALSRLLLRPPSNADLTAVRDPALLVAWPLDRDGATATGLALLTASREDAAAVARDHARLFVGPGHVLAPPWESVHRSNDRLLFDTETLQVRAWYARYGLQAPRLHREPDDHVGLELEFCARLADLAQERPDAREGVASDLGAFVADHVAVWVPAFAAAVVAHADTDVYRAVGHLLSGSVTQAVAAFAGASS